MHWQLGGSGWAEWLWSIEGSEQRVVASYVGPEVLGSFMGVVRDLLSGARSGFVTFFDEPGGARVFFNQTEGQVFVQIVGYPHLSEPQSWWKAADLLWAGRLPTARFADAFMAMVDELLDRYGTAGYRKRWGHDFPAEEWTALHTAHRLASHGGTNA
ncbi:hypothetical protein [Streptomyces sp. WAC06614]|uniref:hypothetical protein n=1 Tax=Streptomyces sp. WAC06614 TaxID=2487416 RepID=UPI000F7874C0|nr:hypothetical protein [Streptomyces sp. WAC06614]RSS76828.1 hypothetical protein EF918_22730 [Streptomyces sp. WAC06614]